MLSPSETSQAPQTSAAAAALQSSKTSIWKIVVKNSDWIDSVESVAVSINGPNLTALSPESGCYQPGHDCKLTENSGWQVYAECIRGGTDTKAWDLFALIDVDYPSVAGIVEPGKLVGYPTSISMSMPVNYNAEGTLTTAAWNSISVDYFKAGYKYCLDKVEMPNLASGQAVVGFIAFSNAAGMGGLQRIIPINNNAICIRYPVRYASVLEKGPMDIKALLMDGTGSGAGTAVFIHDYVKKG